MVHTENIRSIWIRRIGAFSDGLGAGAIVYLREIMEGITYQVAQNENINLIGQKEKGAHSDSRWRKLIKSVISFQKNSQKQDIGCLAN